MCMFSLDDILLLSGELWNVAIAVLCLKSDRTGGDESVGTDAQMRTFCREQIIGALPKDDRRFGNYAGVREW